MDPGALRRNVRHFRRLIMFRPGAGLIAITLLIGAYMLALGVFAIALALRLRMMGRKWAN